MASSTGAYVGFAVLVILISEVQAMSLASMEQIDQWEERESLFANLTNESRYNVRRRPFSNEGTGTPVTVSTSIYIYSMAYIDELHTEYSLQMLYRQTWVDDLLKFPPNSRVQRIVGDKWHVARIWIPSIHVVNNKDIGSFLSADADGTVLMHIEPDGQVMLSQRVKLRPLCKMEFYRYPMDTQQCELELESSTLSTNDLDLTWSEEQPENNGTFFLTGFNLKSLAFEKANMSYWQTGNFSRLIVRFNLEREFGHFLLDIYIPGILFVVTSWMSFWVEIPAAPARVTLGITTMLTLVTSEKAIREKLPKVSYVHALDIWNVICTGFIFASLIEYALVNYIYHKDKRRRKKAHGMKRAESTATFASMDSDTGSTMRMFAKKGETHGDSGMPPKKIASFASLADLQSLSQFGEITCPWPLDEFKLTPQDIANGIDRKCRIVFPLGFLAFNLIYWLVLCLS